MTQLNFGRDVSGFNAFAPQFSDTKINATIASGNHQEFTVPSNFEKWIVVFSYQFGSDIWVSINNIASHPAGGSFALTNSQMIPAQLTLFAGDVISCFNNNALGQDVGIAFYAVP